jgi:hypothetical protein
MIKKWKKILNIEEWDIVAYRIDPEEDSIEYNGESYFIAIERDFETKSAIIYHDIDLDDRSISHELLHIVFPEPYENEPFEEYERRIEEMSIALCSNGNGH